jgi:hypothetical protein
MKAMDVAIVNFNTREHLRRCVQSVRDAGAERVVVADNASIDGSAGMIAETFPEVDLLAMKENLGYGGAANEAIAASAAPYVLLLNADTRVVTGALEVLADHLDRHPRVAVVAPRLLDPEGSIQPSCFPFLGSVQLMLEKSFLGRWLSVLPRLRRRYFLTQWPHDSDRSVPWALGAALGIRREAFEAVGGFDRSFFLFAEEVDLCWRLRRAGWHVHFTPRATVVHAGGQSTARDRVRMAVQRVAGARLFYRRHYPRWRVALLEGMIRGSMLVRWGRDTVRGRLARDPELRTRLAEDVAVWKGAFRPDRGASPSR